MQVKELLREKKLEMLIDPELKDSYVEAEVEELIQIALLCTMASPMERPKMSEIVRMLEGEGLAERWEEWQNVEVCWIEPNQVPPPHPNQVPPPLPNLFGDCSSTIQSETLSGPR